VNKEIRETLKIKIMKKIITLLGIVGFVLQSCTTSGSLEIAPAARTEVLSNYFVQF
jgi:hypothetical protein